MILCDLSLKGTKQNKQTTATRIKERSLLANFFHIRDVSFFEIIKKKLTENTDTKFNKFIFVIYALIYD